MKTSTNTKATESTVIDLSNATDADWRDANNAWMRGIDWFVSKLGSRWVVSGAFGNVAPFKTKKAAYDAATAAVLAEARRRAVLASA